MSIPWNLAQDLVEQQAKSNMLSYTGNAMNAIEK